MEDFKDLKTERHLNALLLREAKLLIKNYEAYLLDKMTSKELATEMLNLTHIIQRIENSGK
jgi:hypothetical protein